MLCTYIKNTLGDSRTLISGMMKRTLRKLKVGTDLDYAYCSTYYSTSYIVQPTTYSMPSKCQFFRIANNIATQKNMHQWVH